jgi:hypothetical protein
MKTDKNFRMSKTTKTLLALLPFKNQEQRNDFKRAMVQAQLASEKASRAPLGKGKKSEVDE